MITKVCDYIKDLMPFDASKIVIGRTNFNVEDFSDDFIIVDILNIVPSARNKTYNGTTEMMSYSTTSKTNVTLDFFGANALDNAMKFINIQSSQKALELQNSLQIGLFHSKNLKNLMEKVGTTYFNRYQIELVVISTSTTDIETLRIDTIQIDVIDDSTIIEDLGIIEITNDL